MDKIIFLSELTKLSTDIHEQLVKSFDAKILGFNVNGSISDEDFIMMTRDCSLKIRQYDEEIQALENEIQSRGDFKKRIDEMRKTLKSATEDASSGVINHTFVEKYINRIYVTPIEENKVELKIKLFTSETTTKYLDKLTLRTGHTSKVVTTILLSVDF